MMGLVLVAPAFAEKKPAKMTAETFEGLALRSIGPAFMSGRIADIAIDPDDVSTWYIAVGSGGVWKTTNAGITFEPLFDDQGSYSIGCVTLDPANPNIVWVGTGENVGGRHVGYGDGVYKSLDGGKSWKNVGLKQSEHIGRILVDPHSSAVVYVAAQGPLWSAGGQRGLYKTTDGGVTWQQVLAKGDFTGVNDVVMDPRDPDVLYAATHQRLRTVAALVDGGPETGIFKSEDGGGSWRELTSGLPTEDMGRIGLAVSPQNPDVVYATIELAHHKGGFYRSADRGETWEKRNDYLSGGTGPHYYQEIFACPHVFDRVYQMDVRIHVTNDGGTTFTGMSETDKHSDNHALAFHPTDPNYLLVGTDGGLYESRDLGKHWRFFANLPVTQFYKVAVDSSEPFYRLYGGTQDNSTQGGPSRTDNDVGIRNCDWELTLYADGHQPAVDPSNPNIVYCEWQQGNLVRHDRLTGENVYLQPQAAPGEPAERWNWDSPILVSPHSSSRLYYASQRLWRSDDRGDSWQAVSPDLTLGLDRLVMPIMSREHSLDALWDLFAMSWYGTITSLAESPLVEGLLYVGTDDGLVQVSEDGGRHWRRIDAFPGVPKGTFVNDVKADLHDPDTVYVVLDNHKRGDFAPYLVKSTDRGATWSMMVGDLPQRQILWRLVQDHVKPELLFLGAELGVFFTVDRGQHWVELQGGVPNIPFRDLAVQRRENDLVGASFGRGFFILDDYSCLREVSEELLDKEATLFPVRTAWRYLPRKPLGRGRGDQGAAMYAAPNPPHGAVFTYYLKQELEPRAKARRTREEALEKQGKDVPFPGWEELRREAEEEEPTILLTVVDAEGEVVRKLVGPVTAGFHRVAWDLRYPTLEPEVDTKRPEWMGPPQGVVAPAGTYTVSLAKRVEGELHQLGQPQTFDVVPMRHGSLERGSAKEIADYLARTRELQRVASGAEEAIKRSEPRISAIKQALLRSDAADDALGEEARQLEQRLADLKVALLGNKQQEDMGEATQPSIKRRVQVALFGDTTYGPTRTHEMNREAAEQALAELLEQLQQLIDHDLVELEERLEAAGVPWTPGRGVPELHR